MTGEHRVPGDAQISAGTGVSLWPMLPELPVENPGDPVELKVIVARDSREAVHRAARGHGGSSIERVVRYYDTPDLALLSRGVAVRVRAAGRGADATVKLRRAHREPLPRSLRRSSGLAIEFDVLPSSWRWSVAVRTPIARSQLHDLTGSQGRLEALLTDEQRLLYALGPQDLPELDHLVSYGPLSVRRRGSVRSTV